MLTFRLFATCLTLAIKFSEEIVFINDHNVPFFFARDFVSALYINVSGLLNTHDIQQDQAAFKDKLIDMQLEVMQGIDYELYVSEETYKQYMEAFVQLYRQSQLQKKLQKTQVNIQP